MRIIKISSVFIVLILIFVSIFSARATSFLYTDSDSGASFIVPDNWSQKGMNESRDVIDAKFISDIDNQNIIIYGSHDIWSELSEEDKKSFSRSIMDNNFYTGAEIAEMSGAPDSMVCVEKYGSYSYYVFDMVNTAEVDGVAYEIPITNAVRVSNGYMFLFMFYGDVNSKYYSDFESLLKSATYPYENENLYKDPYEDSNKYIQSNKDGIDILSIFVSILITIIIYTIPIVIFRYAIIKRPITNKLAIKITIIYAICGFFVMALVCYIINQSAATGGGLLLWSFVNYKILTYGNEYLQNTIAIDNESSVELEENKNKPNKNIVVEKVIKKKDIEKSNITKKVNDRKNQNNIDEQNIKIEKRKKVVDEETLFCRKCGKKLAIDSEFCHKCGVKVIKEEDI